MSVLKRVVVFGVVITMVMVMRVASHDYGDALTKSILFFEGQRSGKLPPTQRMTWRKDSGLRDGFQIGLFRKKPTSVFKNRHLQYANYPPVVSGQLVGASPFGRPLTSLGLTTAQPVTRD